MLIQHQLDEEKELLQSAGSANGVVATGTDNPQAVGPTDTGSQSTIISRAMLHKIGRLMEKAGKPLQELEIPTVRLFGNDGEGNGHEFVITAQVCPTIQADGESVGVLVFVQPDSSQLCLLGMNVLPSLGFTLLWANGEPPIVKPDSSSW